MWKNITDKVLISPSIIATDLSTLGSRLSGFDEKVIDLLHMDVMDGNFVPNITFGPGYMKNLKNYTNIPMDTHLMIEKPELLINSFIELKPWCITIHYESTKFPLRVLSTIRNAKILAGISINPATPVEVLYDLLPDTDMVLIMSVDPGFYGQKFIDSSINRIKRLNDFILDKGLEENVAIQVDGGITKENIKRVYNAGARIIVAGNAAFKDGDVNRSVMDLKEAALRKD